MKGDLNPGTPGPFFSCFPSGAFKHQDFVGIALGKNPFQNSLRRINQLRSYHHVGPVFGRVLDLLDVIQPEFAIDAVDCGDEADRPFRVGAYAVEPRSVPDAPFPPNDGALRR